MEDFQKHLSELGIAAYILMTGYVSDQELIWLYRNCYANLYPSLFEGFGLPVLEGMQFGALNACLPIDFDSGGGSGKLPSF